MVPGLTGAASTSIKLPLRSGWQLRSLPADLPPIQGAYHATAVYQQRIVGVIIGRQRITGANGTGIQTDQGVEVNRAHPHRFNAGAADLSRRIRFRSG